MGEFFSFILIIDLLASKEEKMLNAGALMLYSNSLFSERRLIDLPTSIIIWFTNTCFIKME